MKRQRIVCEHNANFPAVCLLHKLQSLCGSAAIWTLQISKLNDGDERICGSPTRCPTEWNVICSRQRGHGWRFGLGGDLGQWILRQQIVPLVGTGPPGLQQCLPFAS